ncbi:MAG: hypothetical protein ACOY9B_10850 [Pseudomonadota bacterium]|jgi:hypothetical protein
MPLRTLLLWAAVVALVAAALAWVQWRSAARPGAAPAPERPPAEQSRRAPGA